MQRGPLKRAVQRGLEVSGLVGVFHRRAERRLAQEAVAAFEDGRPMPPPELRVAVAGSAHADWFSRSGQAQADRFAALAAAHGAPLDAGLEVLDFGCGSGRIARWLAPEVIGAGGGFSGSDLNPRLVAWCRANLPGRYDRNRLRPPLQRPDASLDVVYAYSVFTHLREPQARAWLAEIARVLRPGGLALLTFHDEAFAGAGGPAEAQAGIAAQPYFVLNDALEGSNYLSAWTTQAHFAALAAPHFRVEAMRPGEREVQATAVLRRPV